MWPDLQPPCLALSVASFVYEINAVQGSTIYLPCSIPPPGQVLANALWSRETGPEPTTRSREQASGDRERLQQLYPLDHDQSAIIRNVLIEDSGTYHCQSPGGERLSTVRVTVTGRLTVPLLHFCTDLINIFHYLSFLIYFTFNLFRIYHCHNKITTAIILFTFCKSNINVYDDILKLCKNLFV